VPGNGSAEAYTSAHANSSAKGGAVSRSKRKTPIAAITTAPSDKAFKVEAHRAARRVTRTVVRKTLDGDDKSLHSKLNSDRYGPKDGKQVIDPKSKRMRK
jgi:hypothetical protein